MTLVRRGKLSVLVRKYLRDNTLLKFLACNNELYNNNHKIKKIRKTYLYLRVYNRLLQEIQGYIKIETGGIDRDVG
jgi:hypothetical protein